MTVDIATLGIAVDTSGVKRAVSDLDALGNSAARNANATKDINRAFTQFNDGLFAHERAAKAAAEAEARLKLEQQALAATTPKLTEGQVHFMEALKEQAALAGKTGAELLRLKAAQLGMADEAAPFIAQIDKAGNAVRKFSIHTAEARESMTSVVRSAMSGDVTQMTASLTTLAGRAGVTSVIFTAMGAAVAGSIAAIGAGLFVLHKSEEQLQQLANVLTVTGNSAGLTADSFQAMTEKVGASSNLGQARESLLVLVATGKMSSDAMEAVGQAAITMARLTGQSAGEVAGEFSKMTDGVTKFVDEFDKKYNILTTAQYEHVRALDAQGRAQEAMTAFGKYVDDALEKNKRSLTGLNKLLQEGKDAWADFWQKAMSFDPNSTQAQIAAIEAKIAGLTEKKPRAELFGMSIGLSDDTLQSPAAVTYLEGLRAKLAGLRKKLEDDAAKAAAEAELKERERLAKEGIRTIEAMTERYGTKTTAMQREEKKYRDAVLAAQRGGMELPPSDQDVAGMVKRIRAAYAEKPDTEGRALSQAAIAHAAQMRDIELKGRLDGLETRRALGDMDETNYQRAISGITLEGIASRKLAEQQMANLAGLSASQKAAHKNRIAQLDEEFTREEFRASNRETVGDKKSVDATFKAVIDDGFAKTAALDAQIQKQKDLNAELGLSSERVRALRAERYAMETAALENQAVEMSGHVARAEKDSQAQEVFKMRLFFLEQEIAKRRELAGMQAPGDAKASDDDRANRMTAQLQNAAGAAREFGDAMAQSFGSAGQAIGGLVRAMTGYGVAQDKIAREQKQALAGTKDKAKIDEINAKAAHKSAAAQVNQYGDMARAAKGFFKEGTKGYEAMEAAEKTFRAVELAMSIHNHLEKSGMLAAFTGLFATAKTAEITAETGTLAPTLAVEGAKASAHGTTGLAAALSLPYPANIPAFAIVAAMLAAIGVAVSGGGASAPPPPPLYETRQKTQGTGTVLGDATAKSASVENSLALIEQNSEIELTTQMGMLRSLRNIESALGNAAARVFQTTGLTGGSAFGTIAEDKRSFFGSDTTKDIADSGVRISGTFGQLRTGAGRGEQYEDVQHTSDGGWFHGDKSWTTTNVKGLDAATMRPFTIIFNEMGNVLVAAGEKLGGSTEALAARINNVQVTFGASTRGLTGEDLVAELSAGVSVAMDEVAMVLFNELDGSAAAREAARRSGGSSGGYEYEDYEQFDDNDPFDRMRRALQPQTDVLAPLTSALTDFQKVGEGAGETLVRLASNYDALDAIMAAIGKSFGAVGVASLRAREDFIDAAGGLDELASKTRSFASNYLTEEERLAPVRAFVTAELTRLGHASVTTRDQFKALVMAQDTSTAAGRNLYLALMDIEQAFADTHETVEDTSRSLEDIASERRGLQDQLDELTMTRAQLRAKERAALAQENRALFDVLSARQDIVDAYERESQALGSTIDRLKQFGSTLASFLTGLDQGSLSALTPMEKMEEARRVYEETLAKAKAGDAQAQGQITQAASNYLTADRVVNASSPTYTADFERVKADLRDLMATAGAQLTEAEQQLAGMKALTATLVDLDDSTVSLTEAIDALRAAIMSQPGAAQIEGLYQSILGRPSDAAGLEDWTNRYNTGTSMEDIRAGFMNSSEKQIIDLYQNILGRAPDQQGLSYWIGRHADGASIEQIAAEFKTSDEYLGKLDGSHAGGLEQVPFDGYTAELHAGEAVIDAPAMAALTRYFGAPSGTGQGGNTAALVAEIRALREEVAQLRGDQERQTGQLVHGTLSAAERSADKAAASTVEAARAQAWALQQAQKMAVK